MARFLVALIATTLIAVQAGAQLGHAAPATSEVFWRAVLPGSPLPDAILRLLRPADTSVVVNKAEVRPLSDYHGYKRRPSDDGLGPFSYENYRKDSSKRAGDTPFKLPGGAAAGTEKRRGTVVGEPPFLYAYKAPNKRQAGGGERRSAVVGEPPFLYAYKQAPSTSHAAGSGASGGEESMARGGGGAAATTTTVFFHEEAVRVGERLPFLFPPATASVLGFLPRRVAESIPFTTRALPGVLAMIGVAPGSAMAASMEATLRTCELPALAGEAKFCATSLEALVERAMAVLGTRDVRPLTSTLPPAGTPLQTYTVRAVRPVEGGPSFVACHDEAYPYTVYRCHTTGPARAYMVEMEGGAGAGAVTVATMCHTDTSLWNPEHVSFRLLGTKPGGEPVCHLMPYGHIIWAKNVKRSPA